MFNNVVMKEYLSLADTAELIGKSKETLRRWDNEGILNAVREPGSNYRLYKKSDIQLFLGDMYSDSSQANFSNKIAPEKEFKVLELFAGAGGLAIGLEKAGIKCAALNEIDKWACQTLRENRPHWKVLEGDIKSFSFKEFNNEVDIVTGGFPCQAFSYAGKKLGLEDDQVHGRQLEELLTIGSKIFYQTHFYPLIKMQNSVLNTLNEISKTNLERPLSYYQNNGQILMDCY